MMTIPEILNELTPYTGRFPREAMRASVITDAIAEMEWWASFRKAGKAPLKGSHAGRATGETSSPPKQHKKPWRNAPCPCGTGEKYKHCCGKPEATKPPTGA